MPLLSLPSQGRELAHASWLYQEPREGAVGLEQLSLNINYMFPLEILGFYLSLFLFSVSGLRRKNKAFLKRSKLAPSPNTTPTLAVTPSDMLIQFQIAAMGCIMGVDSREELRTVLNESETNSEKDNYTISHDREKEQ